MSGLTSRSKWLRCLAHAAMVVGVVVGLGATPGCMCRTRTYHPGGRVVVTRPVYSRPVVARPMVRVAPRPVARPVAPVRRNP